ncbi:unnamed protein product [Anisakis simplex]|uniref:Protein DPCD n=1 Tax=Anisakis simplex TaxID=6269 RepID=A0A0M3IY64_ANISI|nr:unnamed protein product [Anisakis simplex]
MSTSLSVEERINVHTRDEIYSNDSYPDSLEYRQTPEFQLERNILRLQELDLRKREPVLLRCCPLQRGAFKDLTSVIRTSGLHELTEARRALPTSMESDTDVVRYDFASASGRPTKILLKNSPIFHAQWRVLTPMKKIQMQKLDVECIKPELIVSQVDPFTAEQWRMRWENVALRISHGVHSAFNQLIITANNFITIQHLSAHVAYARRFNTLRTLAPVQRKRTLKAIDPQVITLRTLDQGETNTVERIFIEGEREQQVDCTHIHRRTTTTERF